MVDTNPWVHVAPSSFGYGLYANCRLKKNQTICEYKGSRFNINKLKKGTHCAFHIPGTKTFIDGAGEYSPFPRCIASFANHSDKPNAMLQTWPVGRRHPVMLVTLDDIEVGRELLIDYNAGGETFPNLHPGEGGYSEPSYLGPFPERHIDIFENFVLPSMRKRYLNGITICNRDGSRWIVPRIENVDEFLRYGKAKYYHKRSQCCEGAQQGELYLPSDIPHTSFIKITAASR